jgi:hypothetical protein
MIIPFHIFSIYYSQIILPFIPYGQSYWPSYEMKLSKQIKVYAHLHVLLLSLTLFHTCMYISACHQYVYLGEDNVTIAVHGGEWSALHSSHFVPY